jgi:nitronate monooxygenase
MPSPATGRFYGKLMAIAGLTKRVAFLNRGQGWVVRRLRDALPRVRDDRLYEDLKVMLEAHEGNIRRCDRLLRLAHSRGGTQETSPA